VCVAVVLGVCCRCAGIEVLIGKLADAWAPQIADQYLLDNVLAAKGIARSTLREEIGRRRGLELDRRGGEKNAFSNLATLVQ
jgi:hypothetical protein